MNVKCQVHGCFTLVLVMRDVYKYELEGCFYQSPNSVSELTKCFMHRPTHQNCNILRSTIAAVHVIVCLVVELGNVGLDNWLQ